MQNKKINKFLKNSTEYYREHVFSLGFSNTINLVGHGVCAIAMLSMNYVQVHFVQTVLQVRVHILIVRYITIPKHSSLLGLRDKAGAFLFCP